MIQRTGIQVRPNRTRDSLQTLTQRPMGWLAPRVAACDIFSCWMCDIGKWQSADAMSRHGPKPRPSLPFLQANTTPVAPAPDKICRTAPVVSGQHWTPATAVRSVGFLCPDGPPGWFRGLDCAYFDGSRSGLKGPPRGDGINQGQRQQWNSERVTARRWGPGALALNPCAWAAEALRREKLRGSCVDRPRDELIVKFETDGGTSRARGGGRHGHDEDTGL